MKRYKEIKRRLERIKASGKRLLLFKDEGWMFKGLNSPYTSHQEATLTSGHGIERTIVLSIPKTHLIITDSANELLVRGCVKAQLPSFHFLENELFVFPATAPRWLETSRLVNVIYVDEFRGYSVDGAPVFEKKADGFIAVRYPHSNGNYLALSIRKMIDPNWAGVGHIFLTDKQLQEEYTKG